MKRLRKLEGIVEELSGQIEIETVRQPSSVSAGNSPEAPPGRASEDAAIGRRTATGLSQSGSNNSQDSPASGSGSGSAGPGPSTKARGGAAGFGPLRKSSDVHKKFGRLVLNDQGVTRYVSSAFWTSINDEVRTGRWSPIGGEESDNASSSMKFDERPTSSPKRTRMTTTSRRPPSQPTKGNSTWIISRS